jgi:hypothetical protein
MSSAKEGIKQIDARINAKHPNFWTLSYSARDNIWKEAFDALTNDINHSNSNNNNDTAGGKKRKRIPNYETMQYDSLYNNYLRKL